MSPIRYTFYITTKGFPRVSGDEPVSSTRRPGVVEFSPRERG